MMLTQYDIEYLIIFAILAVLFFIGLKPTAGGGLSPLCDRQENVTGSQGNSMCVYIDGTLGAEKIRYRYALGNI